MPESVWIGFDMREAAAYGVAAHTARTRMTMPAPIRGVVLPELVKAGLYRRPMGGYRGGAQPAVLFDDISGAPMSTAFAISRFFVPLLAQRGLALFMDCDVLVRGNLTRLFQLAANNPSKAVWCVKHDHNPPEGLKMDGQRQLPYARKNWSSVMIFNCDHPKNSALRDLDVLNSVPGRDLHRFFWLEDHEIGELDVSWNWLVGHSPTDVDPDVVHFTDGGPWFPGFDDVPYAAEWNAALADWTRGGC